MKHARKYIIIFLYYTITALWFFTYTSATIYIHRTLEIEYIFPINILNLLFIIFISFLAISLTHIPKSKLLFDILLIDLPALFLISLNLLYFSNVTLLAAYQRSFTITTTAGAILLACELHRYIQAFKTRNSH